MSFKLRKRRNPRLRVVELNVVLALINFSLTCLSATQLCLHINIFFKIRIKLKKISLFSEEIIPNEHLIISCKNKSHPIYFCSFLKLNYAEVCWKSVSSESLSFLKKLSRFNTSCKNKSHIIYFFLKLTCQSQ